MKKLQYLFFSFMIFTFFACEKVVEVDIINNEAKIFVEAHLFDEIGNNFVTIRKTQNVFEESLNAPIENAIVSIEENGTIYDLEYDSNGYFRNENLKGESGKKYTLKVELEGNIISGESVMPNKTEYDSLVVALPFEPAGTDTVSFCSEGIYFVFNTYTDIPNEDNFYLIDYGRNGNADDQIYLTDDLASDGIQTQIPFFNNCFNKGDTVNTSLYSLTKIMYDYYFVLSAIANNGGPGGDVTPQNPTTNLNINNDETVLGFFNTATLSRASVVIPD